MSRSFDSQADPLRAAPSVYWTAAAILVLSVAYLVLELASVRPYLWPAGYGFLVDGDPQFAGAGTDRTVILARPPEMAAIGGRVRQVSPGSPAEAAGLRVGDLILERALPDGGRLSLEELSNATPVERLRAWREAYWAGITRPMRLTVRHEDGAIATLTIASSTVLMGSSAIATGWMRLHGGMLLQMLAFTAAGLVLFLLRSGLIGTLSAVALALCAVAGGGPLFGSEQRLPALLAHAMTVFAWVAGPLAFPCIAICILYFPTRSGLMLRHPGLHLVPLAAAAPMWLVATGTALFLAGIDGLESLAVWDATHPWAYYTSFAVALAVNVAAMAEGLHRYHSNPDPKERRRTKLALFTSAAAVVGYVLKDGVSAVTLLATGATVVMPWWLQAVLQALVILPAFGVTYAVAVHRVLGPRWFLRQSLQYALARRTLTLLPILPALLLAWSLYTERHRPLEEIVSGAPAFDAMLFVLAIGVFRYRDRARTWLDERFFRQEYDTRKILVALAGRIRFESDPEALAEMVVGQVDEALHPSMTGLLAAGVEEGVLSAVAVRHGTLDPLPVDGGVAAMLKWSDDPLDLDPADPRSPARRLPAGEREWLERTGATLMVPVLGGERALVGVIVLGAKRSEEPYNAEDKELLSSIAAQVGLFFDAARLRSSGLSTAGSATVAQSTHAPTPTPALAECPRCGRCDRAGVTVCSVDGSAMTAVVGLPWIVEGKYRIEQLLGRGGMGAVYRARDLRLERDVALKVVRPELLTRVDARRRFQQEAQIVAKLQHPAIVSIFDYGTLSDGGAYLVMEFVPGEDLRRVLRREGRLALDRALRILGPTCSAIATAHEHGVLHRDLKPENILLPGGSGEVKVLDFGVAKLVADTAVDDATRAGPTLTVQGAVVGTPAYMAPEQLRGSALDSRSDVFSLGVVAYEMLAGELPFGSASLADIALRQHQPLRPLGSLASVPPAVERAVADALSIDPDERPASPSVFISRLTAAVADARV